MKKKIWFQTDLGYEATREKLKQQKDVIADWECYKGILTIYLKGMKDFSIQITTKGKLGIFYPATANYEAVLEKLKPFLIKADGSQAKIISVIKEPTTKEKDRHIVIKTEDPIPIPEALELMKKYPIAKIQQKKGLIQKLKELLNMEIDVP